MATYAQLRRLAAECRADREKVVVHPDDLEALLDIAEGKAPRNPGEPSGCDGRDPALTR